MSTSFIGGGSGDRLIAEARVLKDARNMTFVEGGGEERGRLAGGEGHRHREGEKGRRQKGRLTMATYVAGGQGVAAGRGWDWIAAGWDLFKRQAGHVDRAGRWWRS